MSRVTDHQQAVVDGGKTVVTSLTEPPTPILETASYASSSTLSIHQPSLHTHSSHHTTHTPTRHHRQSPTSQRNSTNCRRKPPMKAGGRASPRLKIVGSNTPNKRMDTPRTPISSHHAPTPAHHTKPTQQLPVGGLKGGNPRSKPPNYISNRGQT